MRTAGVSGVSELRLMPTAALHPTVFARAAGRGVPLPEAARDGDMDKLRHILETGEIATYEFESSERNKVQ